MKGLVAHLVEHRIRIAGVRGSSPLKSTSTQYSFGILRSVQARYRITKGCSSTSKFSERSRRATITKVDSTQYSFGILRSVQARYRITKGYSSTSKCSERS